MKQIRSPLPCLVLCLLTLGSLNAMAREFDSESEKILYYFGTQIGMQIKAAGISDPAQIALIQEGLKAQVSGQAESFGPEYRNLLSDYLVAQQQTLAQAELSSASEYINAMSKTEGATTTDSGIVYKELQAGTGAQPSPTSIVRAHYRGTLRDGTEFDSSYGRGEPLEISLEKVIKCWTEGIPMMKEGGKAMLYCPPTLAYGDRGAGRIPGNAALAFEIELIEVVD